MKDDEGRLRAVTRFRPGPGFPYREAFQYRDQFHCLLFFPVPENSRNLTRQSPERKTRAGADSTSLPGLLLAQ